MTYSKAFKSVVPASLPSSCSQALPFASCHVDTGVDHRVDARDELKGAK